MGGTQNLSAEPNMGLNIEPNRTFGFNVQYEAEPNYQFIIEPELELEPELNDNRCVNEIVITFFMNITIIIITISNYVQLHIDTKI